VLNAHIIGLGFWLPLQTDILGQFFPEDDHAIDPPHISIPATAHSGVLTNRTSPNLSSTTG
jgi:hypothetical protein